MVRARSCSEVDAHRLVLLGDGARAFRGRVGDHAGDVARARLGGREQLVEQAGEALEPLVEVLGAVSRLMTTVVERGAAGAERLVGAAVARVDHLDRLRERAAMDVELRGERRSGRAASWW